MLIVKLGGGMGGKNGGKRYIVLYTERGIEYREIRTCCVFTGLGFSFACACTYVCLYAW